MTTGFACAGSIEKEEEEPNLHTAGKLVVAVNSRRIT
jgi:hypothetical protein